MFVDFNARASDRHTMEKFSQFTDVRCVCLLYDSQYAIGQLFRFIPFAFD